MHGTAVFSLSVRRLPSSRNFLLACGLEAVLAYLERLRFTNDDVEYLASLGSFTDRFLESLRTFRFTGDVHAVPEGTPVFANEPILEVVAPIAEAQVAETFVMNQIHLQTVLATKAARVVAAAGDRKVVDFGARRMHGVDAALKAARAFHIAGTHGTSNVLAGKLYGVPVIGTMAHSYIQAHEDESEAFRAYARLFPGTVLLVDTYDTLDGVRRVIGLLKGTPDLPGSAAFVWTPAISRPLHMRVGVCLMPPSCGTSRSSPAAASTSTRSPGSSRRARRSTALALAAPWACRATHRRLTLRTSSLSTTAPGGPSFPSTARAPGPQTSVPARGRWLRGR